MKPLEPFREPADRRRQPESRPPDQRRPARRRRAAMWLNNTPHKKTEAEDVRAGTTVDQMIAEKIGQDTTFPSLELATEDLTTPDRRLRQRLQLHLHQHALLVDADDAAADGDQSAGRVRADVRRSGQQGAAAGAHQRGQEHPRFDRATKNRACGASSARAIAPRITEYLDNVREIERRIQTAEKQADVVAGRSRTRPPASPTRTKSTSA